MLQKVKDFFTIVAGWAVAVLLAALWFFNRRKPVPVTPHIEPQKVPESDEEVIKAAEKEGILKPAENAGILKPSSGASILGRR